MKESIIAFVVALVLGAAINGFTSGNASVPPSEPQPSGSGGSSVSMVVPDTSDAGFDNDVLTAKRPVLVDFYSDNCGPCKMMAPTIEKLAAQYAGKIQVYKLDVDSNPSVTARYNVQTIPTFILFKDGDRGDSYTGVVPQDVLVSSINKTLQ